MKHIKLKDAFLAVAFSTILIVPILFINKIPNMISANENRKLAAFPQIFDENGKLEPDIKTGFENWLSDNIGFREQFLNVAANIKVKLLHMSTSEKVHIGEDGWYFYTLDNNLDIPKGTYPLTEDMLHEIAEKQQAISEYYKAQGMEYILVLTPSKASIYPEYIGDLNDYVESTPCDLVESYLKQHTDVKVINCKTALLLQKSEGQLFYKTDTHWTHKGSYAAYHYIADDLKKYGIISNDPVDVDFTEGYWTGEFSSMLGSKGLLSKEKTFVAQWTKHSAEIDSGSKYERINELCSQNPDSKQYDLYFYENPEIRGKTLLVYGDSQWSPSRNIVLWLSEHFRETISTRVRSPNIAIDAIAQPNVVIYGCSERMISRLLLRELTVPERSELPDLPEKTMVDPETYGEWIANQGICVDSCNDKRVGGKRDIQLDTNALSVKLKGWAADFCSNAPFKELYLQVGDIIIKCQYGIERTSVVDHFKKDSLLNTGFQVEFPAAYLGSAPDTEIAFIGVSADGQYLYQPVIHYVHRS